MATSPNSAAQTDPSAGAGAGDGSDDDASQAYTICITVDGDQISVGVQPGDGDADDQGGSAAGGGTSGASGASGASGGGDAGSDSGGGMTPVKNIKEALTVALEIYRSGGQVEDADADFNSGYASQQQPSAPPTGGGQ